MSRVLAFDVGKSGCRVALFVDGVRIVEAQQPGPRGLADRTGATDAADAMLAAARELGADPVDGIAVGLAGLTQAPHAPAVLAEHLLGPLGADRLVAASDMTTSHLGALAGGAGVVVAAGTGAVALAVADTGTHHRVDGWGYLLGDAGSGHAIGRAGLDAALRCHDGRGGSQRLRSLAQQRFGSLDDLPRLVHGSDNPPRTIAAFARDVASAAHEGDDTARALWVEAGRDLAVTAAAAARALAGEVLAGEVLVSTVGGLFDAGTLLTEPFETELSRLAPRARLVAPAGDALDGAHRMAGATLPHDDLLTRIERPLP